MKRRKEEEEVEFFFSFRESSRAISLGSILSASFSMDAKPLSPCDTEKLKRCLEEHDGDAAKCSHLISAFKSSCGKQQKEEASNTPTEQAVAAVTPTTEK